MEDKNMVTTNKYLIKFENYSNTAASVFVYNITGSLIFEGRVQIDTLKTIANQLYMLLMDNISIFINLPMTNTLYKYSLYGNLSYRELYNISLVREKIADSTDEIILKESVDNFELIGIIGLLDRCIKYLNGELEWD